MSSGTPSLVITAVTFIVISSLCDANTRVPPKFLRATRGANKALYATNYGPPGPATVPSASSPRKIVIEAAKLNKNVVIPRSRYYKTGYGRTRRRKTQRKKVKKPRRPHYPYGVPVYAQKYKHYKPYKRPSRYKSRPSSSRRPVSYIRVPVYKDHEIVEEPEDYEGEYDMRLNPHQDFEEEEQQQQHKRPPIKKEKIRKQKFNPQYKRPPVSEWVEPESPHQDDVVDNGYRTIVPRPTMMSRPAYHPIYEEQEVGPYWHDTETAYTNQPSPTQSTNVVPPYIITSNNYGGRYNYNPYSHQYIPPNNKHNNNRPNNGDADIGYGQGMEVIDDGPKTSWG